MIYSHDCFYSDTHSLTPTGCPTIQSWRSLLRVGSDPQGCSHFSHHLQVLGVSKPTALLLHPATNLGLPITASVSIVFQNAHRTCESAILNDYHLNIKNANEQQMKRHTGQVWEGPEHRSFCLHGVWGHHPPGTSICSPIRKLSSLILQSFIKVSWCRHD